MTREEQIVAMADQGLTFRQIAARMQTTRSAVASVLYRYRKRGKVLATRKPMGQHVSAVRDMRAQNVKCADIAIRLGITTQQVKNIIRGYGIPPKPGKGRG